MLTQLIDYSIRFPGNRTCQSKLSFKGLSWFKLIRNHRHNWNYTELAEALPQYSFHCKPQTTGARRLGWSFGENSIVSLQNKFHFAWKTPYQRGTKLDLEKVIWSIFRACLSSHILIPFPAESASWRQGPTLKIESMWQHFLIRLLKNSFFWDQSKTVQDWVKKTLTDTLRATPYLTLVTRKKKKAFLRE